MHLSLFLIILLCIRPALFFYLEISKPLKFHPLWNSIIGKFFSSRKSACYFIPRNGYVRHFTFHKIVWYFLYSFWLYLQIFPFSRLVLFESIQTLEFYLMPNCYYFFLRWQSLLLFAVMFFLVFQHNRKILILLSDIDFLSLVTSWRWGTVSTRLVRILLT